MTIFSVTPVPGLKRNTRNNVLFVDNVPNIAVFVSLGILVARYIRRGESVGKNILCISAPLVFQMNRQQVRFRSPARMTRYPEDTIAIRKIVVKHIEVKFAHNLPDRLQKALMLLRKRLNLIALLVKNAVCNVSVADPFLRTLRSAANRNDNNTFLAEFF